MHERFYIGRYALLWLFYQSAKFYAKNFWIV